MAKWRLIKLNRSHASLLQICPYSLGRKTNKSTSSKSDRETQKCSSETTKPEIPINFANFLSHSWVSLSTIFWSCQQTAACYESSESTEGPCNHTFAGCYVHVYSQCSSCWRTDSSVACALLDTLNCIYLFNVYLFLNHLSPFPPQLAFKVFHDSY